MKKNNIIFVGGLAGVAVLLIAVLVGVLIGSGSSSESAADGGTATAEQTSRTVRPTAVHDRFKTPQPTVKPTKEQQPAAASVDTISCFSRSLGKSEKFSTVQEAWSRNGADGYCEVTMSDLHRASEQQLLALETSYPDNEDRIEALDTLYGICASMSGIPIDNVVSGRQAQELAGAFMLCPDHPKAAQIENNIASGQVLLAEEQATKDAIASGRQQGSGKYLIGVDVEPGIWQSVGEKVQDCYWEISDAQGNILANNFISVAPQFTIEVPAGASGFTIEGCTFRKIG